MNLIKISKLTDASSFRARLRELEVDIPFTEQWPTVSETPLNQPLAWGTRTIGNRFCILPMEGWDATRDGKPTELTLRRWRNFGISGAKLIWGGEAVAIRHDGRANPNQLLINQANLQDLAALRSTLIAAHDDEFGSTSDLQVGLQLTHSGRFACPNQSSTREPLTAYAHPVLDPRFQIDPNQAVLSDDDLKRLIDDFIAAAALASQAGFEWIDIKHCHGYLGHELLSGMDRSGEFGGSFENRTRFLRDIVAGIRATTPELEFGIRLSIFDLRPFERGPDGVGIPVELDEYRYAWGADSTGLNIDLTEPHRFLSLMKSLGIELLCTSAGSPYYNPHIQRPAVFPPSDGYLPPEDPLVGVARQIQATAELKRAHPDLIVVGSGYSYLQDWLPHVAHSVVHEQAVDCVGIGRLALSYPDFPADVLNGSTIQRKKICRTFSDCTTAPRNGLVSGCYPLDRFYKLRPEYQQLQQIKRQNKSK